MTAQASQMNRIEEIADRWAEEWYSEDGDVQGTVTLERAIREAVREAANVPLATAAVFGEHGSDELKIRIDAAKGASAAILRHFGLSGVKP